ncbi:MAG: dehydratase [SAR324 cluster bacterium]|nr:dehydratase [SAR324 cluster bacterium]
MSSCLPLTPGQKVTFSKTLSESDIYLFAGITGDLARNHVDEEYMKRSVYGRRIAHGVLLMGFMSTASTLILENYTKENSAETPVSLGYDRVRFVKPVFINDTITVHYEIKEIDLEKSRSRSQIDVKNQHGDTVAVAEHILAWVKNEVS